MTNLFQLGNFKSHSGEVFPWKIDCDGLTIEDWSCLAWMIFDKVGKFGKVEGVPRGGLILEARLMFYIYGPGPLLMPFMKVKGGWKWGKTGKVYKTRQEAIQQGMPSFSAT